MLNERQRQLLTAYVDGELSEPQRQEVHILLEASAEARLLLEQLERDALVLRQLVPPSLDRDLAGSVLENIARRRLVPRRRHVPTGPVAYPAWAGLATAAAVLLLLGGTTYFYFAASFNANQDDPAVAKNHKPEPQPADLPHDLLGPVEPDNDATPEFPPAIIRKPDTPPQPPKKLEKLPEESKPKPVKTPVPPPDVIAAPSMEKFDLKMVTLQLPMILRLRDLDKDRSRLLEELGQDTIFRVELPCRNASRAFERLQAAAKDQRFGLMVDSYSQDRLKFPQLKTNYAFFAEDLTPEDVGRLLVQIGAEDHKASLKRPAEAHFDRVVVGRMSKSDRKELADLLGFDPSPPPASRSLGPLDTDPSRPLPELTAAQVAQALKGQGGARSEAGKTPAKPAERQALVAAFGPPRPRTTATEGKRFQDLRKPPRQGSVQIFLILRHTGT